MAIDPEILDYVALGIFIVVSIFLIYLVIYIHDIPYEIAKKREHPHQDAIHIAGWVSLFLMHTIWPFLWIWAYLYKPGRGWGAEAIKIEPSDELKGELKQVEILEKKVGELEDRLESLLKNTRERMDEVDEAEREMRSSKNSNGNSTDTDIDKRGESN
jgi:hypothetical protein